MPTDNNDELNYSPKKCIGTARDAGSISDQLANELADLHIGPILPGSPVYRAYVGDGFAEPPTSDLRGCIALGSA